MERGRFPVDDLPHLQAWWARLNRIAAWRDTSPSADLPE
jgi:glutathione S-transferase